jgi:hypothetical protein
MMFANFSSTLEKGGKMAATLSAQGKYTHCGGDS